MDSKPSTSAYVAAAASRLRRAAGDLQRWVDTPDAVSSLPVALGHVEDALDQLATSMQLMARSVEGWRAEGDAIPDEDALQPEARALRHQLRTISDMLIDARDGCPAACEWARRLLGDAATEHLRPAAAETSQAQHRVASDLVARPRRGAAKTGARLQNMPSRRGPATEAA
jgi:hypothetical protein